MFRHGRCIIIFLNPVRNFIGTSRKLKHIQNLVKHPDQVQENYLTSENMHRKFILPRNLSGLWEAGVKLIEVHLKKAVANLKLTYTECLTITAKVENTFNSRPINPLSNDANDSEALAPHIFSLVDINYYCGARFN